VTTSGEPYDSASVNPSFDRPEADIKYYYCDHGDVPIPGHRWVSRRCGVPGMWVNNPAIALMMLPFARVKHPVLRTLA